MAVAPDYQRRGIGTELFRYTLNKFRSQMPDSVGLLLEIQREEKHDPRERQIREDRIRFYTKLGAKVLAGVHYLLPPQHGRQPEEMYLMIVPLKKIRYVSKDTLVEYIRDIHSNVYQYESDDLLEAAVRRMPKMIRLSDVILTPQTQTEPVSK